MSQKPCHCLKDSSWFITFFRKVQTETATGSTSSDKKRLTLTVTVENIDFDIQACVLRVKGRNIQENAYVKVKVNINIFRHKIIF